MSPVLSSRENRIRDDCCNLTTTTCRDPFSEEYRACALCAHRCGVDRFRLRGRCGEGAQLRVARASLHLWEEPPISGTRGSGTVFFCGCSLRCVFCQNHTISRDAQGESICPSRLARIFLSLQEKGAHNINLVTPTHFAPGIRQAILLARDNGLLLPIVYNTSSFDAPETVKRMADVVDIWLADYKYILPAPAARLSGVPSYAQAAREALAQMVRARPACGYTEDGLMRHGVLVRVLVLPGHLANAKLTLRYLHDTYRGHIRVSILRQYTPPSGADLPRPLDRPLTRSEYREVVDYAWKIGLTDAFIQEEGVVGESFVPAFDGSGLCE